ncbi:MAG TPA: cytochrome c peroxidase [Vineibacter sp.]|nr:cytochrome c peroxidase [Vineibacter sp.]
MQRSLIVLLAATMACLPLLLPLAQPAPEFSEAERRRILAHGPWPPAPVRDPSNRVSGRPDAIALGERLFFDRRLSGGGNMACDWCHTPSLDWTDGFARGVGRATVDRNTTALWNVGHQRWFGWGGANDSLWSQSVRPLLDAREMDMTAGRVAERVRTDADLACRYERVFGQPPAFMDDETVLVAIGKLLAAFQETLVSGRTPFDDFRDALASGDTAGMARYPAAARRGLKIFVGRGNCAVCHFGPLFTNGEFADIGVPFFLSRGGVDSGRHDGLRRLRDSRLNLLGPYNDDPDGRSAVRTRHVEPQQRNFGEFKVPGLRNVARTAPYMHNGSLATLRDVVRHYSDLNEDRLHADGERILRPLRLSPGESDDLIAFLESLSDRSATFARRTSPIDRTCP